MRTRLTLILAAAAVVIALAPTTTAVAAQPAPTTPFSVMTRNLDLGSDYGPVFAATDAASFAHGVTTTYDEIVASNVPERATGIAHEIADTMPTVVSLQEVSLVQQLVPTSTGLTVVNQIDQLALLQNALSSLGLHYAVAAQVNEFDVTVPSDAGYYARVRDGEAILVRSDLPATVLSYANPQTGHFTNLLPLPTPFGVITAVRGWASVDVSTLGATVRVVATHLEGLAAPFAAAQAGEILDGPANTTLPVVVAGDLNSGPGTTTAAYDVMAAAMTDTWSATRPRDNGYTLALHGEDFFPYQTTPTSRVDLIFTRGVRPVIDSLIGTADLTPSGLYPSDHAGVVARLIAPSAG